MDPRKFNGEQYLKEGKYKIFLEKLSTLPCFSFGRCEFKDCYCQFYGQPENDEDERCEYCQHSRLKHKLEFGKLFKLNSYNLRGPIYRYHKSKNEEKFFADANSKRNKITHYRFAINTQFRANSLHRTDFSIH